MSGEKKTLSVLIYSLDEKGGIFFPLVLSGEKKTLSALDEKGGFFSLWFCHKNKFSSFASSHNFLCPPAGFNKAPRKTSVNFCWAKLILI